MSHGGANLSLVLAKLLRVLGSASSFSCSRHNASDYCLTRTDRPEQSPSESEPLITVTVQKRRRLAFSLPVELQERAKGSISVLRAIINQRTLPARCQDNFIYPDISGNEALMNLTVKLNALSLGDIWEGLSLK